MNTIKQIAQDYVPPQTYTIDQLSKVSVDEEVFTATRNDKDGKAFTYEYIKVDDKEYRMPVSVKAQLKTQLEENKTLRYFKAKKEIKGNNTTYTVIPLSNEAL